MLLLFLQGIYRNEDSALLLLLLMQLVVLDGYVVEDSFLVDALPE